MVGEIKPLAWEDRAANYFVPRRSVDMGTQIGFVVVAAQGVVDLAPFQPYRHELSCRGFSSERGNRNTVREPVQRPPGGVFKLTLPIEYTTFLRKKKA